VPKNRFITPETTRLDLSDDDWIDVKKRLSWGEETKITASTLGGMRGMKDSDNTEITMDWAEFQLRRLSTWIVDWSFVDARGKQVKVTRDAIKNLDPDTVDEIDEVLTAHIEAQEAERRPETADAAIEKHQQAIDALEMAKNAPAPDVSGQE